MDLVQPIGTVGTSAAPSTASTSMPSLKAGSSHLVMIEALVTRCCQAVILPFFSRFRVYPLAGQLCGVM